MGRGISQQPRTVRLHSANNDFQRIEVLRRNRQKRRQYREFFLEGVRPMNLALEHGWEIRAFIMSLDRPLSDWAKDILRTSHAPLHYELPAHLAAQLSGKTETSELMAIVRMPADDLARIALGASPRVVVFDRPSSPGNLGSTIRSADALGADGMVTLGHGVDLYDPETISASRGSLFALPTVRVDGLRELDPWLDQMRERLPATQIVALEEEADVELWDLDLAGATVLLLGTEKWGLSAALKERATVMARIPMEGAASSLNVAAAASIALYEMARQRANRGA